MFTWCFGLVGYLSGRYSQLHGFMQGNYTQYCAAKAERIAMQWAAYEKQQKEIARQVCRPAPPCLCAWAQPLFSVLNLDANLN